MSQIAYLNTRGELSFRAAKSTDWSCYDTITTQILNWSQSCRNRQVATTGRFQPSQKTAGLGPVRESTPPRQSGSGIWPVLELNWTEPPVKTQTAGGLPGPAANTRDGWWRWEWCGGSERIWAIRGTTCLIGLGRPRIGITWWIGTRSCCIRDGKFTRTQTSLMSQFLMMISPISSHISSSHPQLYHHLKTWS